MAVKLLINSLFKGGAEKQFSELARNIPNNGMYLLEDQTDLPTVGLNLTPLSKHTAATSAALKTFSIPIYARRLAARVKPGETVLSFMERANFVNVLASIRTGHKAVICERTRPSGEFTGLRALVFKPLIKKLYPRAALIVVNSNGVKNDLVSNFSVPEDKIKLINNGYDMKVIAEKAKEPLSSPYDAIFKRPVLITCGRLTPAKGQWHLLRIFKQVKALCPDAALVILGEGELTDYLTDLSKALGLKTFKGSGAPPPDYDVYFSGFEPNPYKFFSRARLFMFTSLWEGFPNAVVEAMACGLPVISSDCASGPREILAPDTPSQFQTYTPEPAKYGMLMPPLSGLRRRAALAPERSEMLWTGAVASLLNDKSALEKYSRAGLERVKDFDLSKTTTAWLDLLVQA